MVDGISAGIDPIYRLPSTIYPIAVENLDDLTAWNVVVGRVSGRWDRTAVKVKPFSTTPGRFAAGAKLCALTGTGPRLLTVHTSRASGNRWILDCGLDSTEAADALQGVELFIHPSMRPPLPPDEFYLDQLLGLRVLTENGDDLGEIEEVLETPANNVYVTPHAMIPGHSDFIVKTDFEHKLLVVRDIPGLRTDET